MKTLRRNFIYKKLFCIFIQSFLLFSCVVGKSNVEELSLKGECETAADRLDTVEIPARIWGRTSQTVGTVVSMTAAGAGYVQDGFLIVVGDVIAPVAICTVAIPVDVFLVLGTIRMNGSPGAIDACGKAINKKNGRWSAGSKIYDSTAGIRSLDLTPFSQSVRAVSACYRRRGGRENELRALLLLHQMRDNREVFEGLEAGERQKVIEDISSLNGKPPVEVVAAPAAPKIDIKMASLKESEKFVLGRWRSSKGKFINGGHKPELSGKSIEGTTEITVDPASITVEGGLKDSQEISFVTTEQEARAIFRDELSKLPTKYAIVKYPLGQVFEFFGSLPEKGMIKNETMYSVRFVSYYSDGDKKMMIRREWQRA